MIYQFDSRVRYSEVDENRRITLLSILNYFQDCSSFHSEKIGFGIDYLKEKQCAWVLSSWQIVLGELPVFGQEITVQTWPYSFKGFLGERNFCIRDEKGEKLAWANTLWTYVIALPEEMEKKEYFLIVKHHIDTNHHVNNGQYVQMAMELLPDDFRISQMRAEYKKAALLGDMVVPYIHIEEKKCTVLLCDEAQKPYAVVEFQ